MDGWMAMTLSTTTHTGSFEKPILEAEGGETDLGLCKVEYGFGRILIYPKRGGGGNS